MKEGKTTKKKPGYRTKKGLGHNSVQKRRSAMKVVYTVEQKKKSGRNLQEAEVICGHD